MDRKIVRRIVVAVVLPPALLLLLGALGGVVWALWPSPRPEPPVDFENYTPSQEFREAYRTMRGEKRNVQVKDVQVEQAADVKAEEPRPEGYNLERTMQTIRSVELAQKDCGDWMTFLKVLARQDYDGVPEDVKKAQSMILPIMERIHSVEKEVGDSSSTMTVLNSLGDGAMAVVEKVDIATLATVYTAGPAALLVGPGRKTLDAGMNSAIGAFKKSKLRHEELVRKLREVQIAYVNYLSSYVPIRRKYEKEWDALCLAKDKAYLEVGRGQYAEALVTTQEIMKRYPYDREAILLRVLSLARVALAEARKRYESQPRFESVELKRIHYAQVEPDDPQIVEAVDLLARYLRSYPEASGPALVLKGLVECATGDLVHALVSFDQSSIEYPRQAATLNNMLEVYASRHHLEKTAEGQRLLQLHRSLCEGFGAFSPNLEKAFAYEREQNYVKSKEEIYNHFFRRGNQEVFHELFSDMEFCEKNLSVGFRGLLLERSFLDLDVRNAGWTDESEALKVSLKNRTDFELRNVRVFLCVQYTEMYKGEYDVLKVGAVGRLGAGEAHEFPELAISRSGKTFRDITRTRAIVMSDDRICWVDPVDEKRKHANEVNTGVVKVDLPFTPAEYLGAFGTDVGSLGKMAREMPVTRVKKLMVMDELELSLPRVFAVLDPVFTIGEIGSKDCVYPSEKNVAGAKIVLRFPVSLKEGDVVAFCIYGDYSSFKVELKRRDDVVVVDHVEPIKPLRAN